MSGANIHRIPVSEKGPPLEKTSRLSFECCSLFIMQKPTRVDYSVEQVRLHKLQLKTTHHVMRVIRQVHASVLQVSTRCWRCLTLVAVYRGPHRREGKGDGMTLDNPRMKMRRELPLAEVTSTARGERFTKMIGCSKRREDADRHPGAGDVVAETKNWVCLNSLDYIDCSSAQGLAVFDHSLMARPEINLLYVNPGSVFISYPQRAGMAIPCDLRNGIFSHELVSAKLLTARDTLR